MNFRIRSLRLLHRLDRSKAIWLRALLSLFIGITALFTGDKSHYDQRFQIRGSQNTSQKIILLSVSPPEWRAMAKKMGFKRPNLYRWQPELWSRVLSELQKGEPYRIGITLSFTRRFDSHPQSLKDATNVYWSSSNNQNEKAIRPHFLDETNKNFGISQFHRDNDGVIRRHYFPKDKIAFLEKMTETKSKNEHPIINFRGKKGQFKSFRLTDFIDKNYPDELLKDKYVLIGYKENYDQTFLTPTGPMPKLELLANILDNITEQRWIDKLPQSLSITYLLLLLIGAVWVMSIYPQTIGLAFLFWLGTMTTAISLWVFDSFYFWIPVLAPLCLLTVIYIVFLSFQLTLKENTNWRLEQERKIRNESEKLKSNFVSLISHDLKTPIAKIQAICDRLIRQTLAPQHIQDLKSLRHESAELHRYIQSILRMSRIESQDFQIHKDAADINEIIENVTHQLKPIAKEKNITIKEDLEPMFLIELDSVLIHEVILNVIENSIKYSKAGGHIDVKTQEQGNRVEIRVIDQGPGINEDDRKKIFEKFYRAPKQITNTKGTGLGLYLVKYFIELHGGKVSLESRAGHGTEVQIYLPIFNEKS